MNEYLTCIEEETTDYPELPVVVVVGVSGVGKSTFCNYLSGFSEEDSSGFHTGTTLDESSITKEPTKKRVKWRGSGDEFILIDTPGLGDPGGNEVDKEQFKKVIQLLRDEVKNINVIIHVVRDTKRKHPHLKRNLRLLKFMFGDSLKENMVNEVTFWANYEHSKEDRDFFRNRRNKKHQELFNETDINIKTFFIDPVDALPEKLKKTKQDLYTNSPGSWVTQEQELEGLKTFIWSQEPFSCQDTCRYAEELFETQNDPFPTIKRGDQYGETQFTKGEKLQIDCLVAALDIGSVNPRRIKFYYNDTRILKNDVIVIAGEISDEFLYTMTLTIDDVDISHAGEYSCKYRSKKAKVELDVTVAGMSNV